jgi:hypothetical protein
MSCEPVNMSWAPVSIPQYNVTMFIEYVTMY